MFDLNAPRNAPAKNPEQHLDRITFHSSFFQYEVAAGPVSVGITHSVLPTKTTVIGLSGEGGSWGLPRAPSISVTIYGADRNSDILLFTHNLGYVPRFMVSLSGRRVTDGHIIQNASDHRRRVSVWASSTGIYLRESCTTGQADCPAITLTYRVMVFRESRAEPVKRLFSGGPSQPLVLAKGVIDSSKKYLRRTGAGDTSFAQNLGRTLDCNNGAIASASGGVITAESGYGGSLSAPPFIAVGVD